MKQINVRGRDRIAASLAISMAMFGGVAAVTAGPAQSAPPTGDCAEAYPVADLVAGAPVTGLTVSKGTAPDGFTGEVLGVLQDGIAPGLDMVMVELTSPELERDDVGIWQGMSGSPVYAQDGRLIGAVAYGLAWGESDVAGVTPYEEMDNYMSSATRPTTIKVGTDAARAIAQGSDVTQEQASEGFRQLPMPLGISGVLAKRLDQSAGERAYLQKGAYAIGGSSDAAEAADMVAGGNLAAAMSYGDLTSGGVGTVTSVCGDRVVGFGHPMSFLGTTSLTLHPAEAVYVQADPLGPAFKVANFGEPVGTITDDHLSGISGVFDVLPDTMDVTSTVAYRDRNRTGTTHVSVPEANAEMTFYQQIANHDRVIDGIIEGSELMTWTISGTDSDGSPFSFGMTDRFASDYDIAFESPWEVADLVYYLSSLPDVTVDDVTVDAAVNDDNSTWRVAGLEQRRGGDWVKVGKGSPVLAKAGQALKIRALLRSQEDTRTVPLSIKVPANAAGKRGSLYVVGGLYAWSDGGRIHNVDDVADMVEAMVRNDEVKGQLMLEGRRKAIERNDVSDPTDKVVEGQKRVRVRVS